MVTPLIFISAGQYTFLLSRGRIDANAFTLPAEIEDNKNLHAAGYFCVEFVLQSTRPFHLRTTVNHNAFESIT